MRLKKYFEFINEDVENELATENDENQFSELKSDLEEMIGKSLKTSDTKTQQDFIDAYIRNPEDTQIEGLVNDSDIYEFYLKYRNDIDELLSKYKFYDESPSEMNSFSLYDYLIQGTKKAILELIKQMNEGEPKEEAHTEETPEVETPNE
jgi:hypothetical protein